LREEKSDESTRKSRRGKERGRLGQKGRKRYGREVLFPTGKKNAQGCISIKEGGKRQGYGEMSRKFSSSQTTRPSRRLCGDAIPPDRRNEGEKRHLLTGEEGQNTRHREKEC